MTLCTCVIMIQLHLVPTLVPWGAITFAINIQFWCWQDFNSGHYATITFGSWVFYFIFCYFSVRLAALRSCGPAAQFCLIHSDRVHWSVLLCVSLLIFLCLFLLRLFIVYSCGLAVFSWSSFRVSIVVYYLFVDVKVGSLVLCIFFLF